jgi:N4-gp56 family major capsid protein
VAILGEQAAQTVETIRFNILKAGTNVFYGNKVAGRSSVVTAISLADQRRVTRAFQRQNAGMINTILKSTPNFNTESTEPGYIGLIHPDLSNDVRSLTGFINVKDYGVNMIPIPGEIGAVEDVRYIRSTIFTAFADAGGAAGSLVSTSGTSADVYPILYLAKDSYGIVPLKGQASLTPMIINPKASDSDPLAQRGYASWKTMQTAVILNEAWIARLEVGANDI